MPTRPLNTAPTPEHAARGNRVSTDRSRGRTRDRIHPATGDPDYSACELAFLKACDEFKRHHRTQFLTHTDHLKIARTLGWKPPSYAALAC